MARLNIQIPDVHQEWMTEFDNYRYFLLSGGRASSKSFNVGLFCLNYAASVAEDTILCTREIQNTIKDSVHRQLEEQIDMFKLPYFNVGREYITHTKTKTQFMFKGLYRNIDNIKSIPNIGLVWNEESATLSKESLDVLIPTIRKAGSKIIFTFNPRLETDPLWIRFMLKPYMNSYYMHSTYLQNPYCTQEIIDEANYLMENDYDEYCHIYLGHLRTDDLDTVFKNSIIHLAMNRKVDDEGQVEYGVDPARYGDDDASITKRKGMDMKWHKEYPKTSVTQLANIVKNEVGNKQDLIKIDMGGLGCFTDNCKILTTQGWKRPSDIKVDDTAISKDSNGYLCNKKVISNTKDYATVLNSDGIEFSYNHPVFYKTRKKDKIKQDDWFKQVACSISLFDTEFMFKGNSDDFVIDEKTKTDSIGRKYKTNRVVSNCLDFSGLLGWVLAEGCVYGKNITIVQSVKKPKENHESIIKHLKACGNIVNISQKKDIVRYKIANKPLADWITENCYTSKKDARFLKLPEWIKNKNKECIGRFIDCYRMADGYIHKGNVIIYSASLRILEDMQILLLKVNKLSNIHLKAKAGSTSYIGERELTRTVNCYELLIKKNNVKMLLNKKTKIIEKQKVYNIRITGKTKALIVKFGNTIFWTHNCGVYDILHDDGYNVKEINFGGKADDPDRYANTASEMWGNLKKNINEISLVEDRNLMNELTTRKYKIDNKGRFMIESKDDYKKRGYKSPNIADSTIIAFHEPQNNFYYDFV